MWGVLEPLLKDKIFEAQIKFVCGVLKTFSKDEMAEGCASAIPYSTIVVLATADGSKLTLGSESYKLIKRYLEIVRFCYEAQQARA